MRVLVTGGAGYIGSTLVSRLLESHKVTVLDNFMYGQVPFGGLCHDTDLRIVRGDARDRRLVTDLVKKHDIIIPLAALVGAPLCDRDGLGATSTNVGAVKSIMECLGREQRVLVPISNSGYGVGDQGKECTEESPLRPISLYGRTKVEAEKIVMEHPNSTSFRLATVFGMSPRMRLDLLVNDFVWRAVHDRAVVLFEANFKRNYLHVRDAARAFKWGIAWDGARGQTYNVGLSSANLSKRELCEKIKEHVPGFVALESPVGEDPDKRDYVVSNAKIEAAGWEPLYSLDEGIVELVKGYAMMRKVQFGNI